MNGPLVPFLPILMQMPALMPILGLEVELKDAAT